MATYQELLTIATTESGAVLRDKIKVAAIVACDTIRSELVSVSNHANRLKWAYATLQDPVAAANRLVWAVLAQNKAATAAQITGAADATVQTAVDAAVDLLAQG
jgi:hypothetical protein